MALKINTANGSVTLSPEDGSGNVAVAIPRGNLASETYVDTAISTLVDTAPDALNTLNELAAALSDDANFATTVTDSLALKAPLASPNFTGTVTANGLSLGDNEKAQFGASNDLEIYHDGSASFITDSGTGNLRIQGTNLSLQNADGTKNYFLGIDGGASSLYFNNNSKIQTTATGIDVTGEVTAANYSTEVYALTGTEIDPANGGIQTKTLSGATTFTEVLSSGESVVLMIDGGDANAVTWPTITWVTSAGNAAPTLTANDTIVLWKVSTTLYGAYTGSYT